MEGYISIKEILEHMDSGRPFALTYVKCDRKRGTGGQLTTVKSATKTGIAVKDGTILTGAIVQKAQKQNKNPNHYQHFTRNIVLRDKTVRTVHVDLITQFNGKRVL